MTYWLGAFRFTLVEQVQFSLRTSWINALFPNAWWDSPTYPRKKGLLWWIVEGSVVLSWGLSLLWWCWYLFLFYRFPIVEPDPDHTKLHLSKAGLEAIERITSPISAVAVSWWCCWVIYLSTMPSICLVLALFTFQDEFGRFVKNMNSCEDGFCSCKFSWFFFFRIIRWLDHIDLANHSYLINSYRFLVMKVL